MLQLWYTVDRPKEGWKYSSGFVDADMIKEHLFEPSDKNLVLLCGPPPMINFACQPNLDKLGHCQEMRFVLKIEASEIALKDQFTGSFMISLSPVKPS